MGRGVVYSQTFGARDLYKVLTLLLESSLIASRESIDQPKALVPAHGESLEGELCTLTEDSFHYERVKIEKVNYCTPPLFVPG